MKILIESPEKLSVSDLENIVDVWNRNSSVILYLIMIHNTELYDLEIIS